MAKSKKESKEPKESKEVKSEDNYDARLAAIVPFAKPLASKKLNKKLLKTVKKASKAKNVKRGVKEVVKALRKGDKGLVVIAGDIYPEDVISHIPVLCEENSVPYIFIPSKQDLGSAGSTKRPTSVVFIVPGSNKRKDAKAKEREEEYKESFNEVVKEVQAL